jgi:hypothetical protein
METKRKNDIQPLTDHPDLVEYCSLCEATFQPRSVSVIGDNGRTQLLHTACTRCGSSVIVLLVMNDLGLRSVGFLTDLTGEDVFRFKGMERLSSDDVLDVHRFLSDEG